MIKGDPKRQATSSIKGYLYQFWFSALKWVELTDNEKLYLECAEDLEVTKKEAIHSYQVKEKGKKLTLRDKDVIDAINNFWNLKNANPDCVIVFNFLTTATITTEKGSHFKGKAGLKVWESAKRSNEAAEKIKLFLLNDDKISQGLIEFLENSEIEEIREKIIQPINWVTKQPNKDEIEELIKRRLFEIGQKLGLGPYDSIEPIHSILNKIIETSVNDEPEKRVLDKLALYTLIERKTKLLVPKSKYNQQWSNQSEGSEILPLALFLNDDTANFDIDIREKKQGDIPTIIPGLLIRNRIIEKLVERLKKSGCLLITGSSGKGKSTLSQQLSIKIGDLEKWRWVSFSNTEIDLSKKALTYIYNSISLSGKPLNFIFDDIDISHSSFKKYEGLLIGVIYSVLERGGYIILTTSKKVSTKVLNNSRFDAYSAEPFTEKDVIELLTQHGCSKEWANKIGKYIQIQTSGHPQLVHARVKTLQDNSWAIKDLEDLFIKTDDIKKHQVEARELLVDSLPEQERVFLYALSIFGGKFSKEQALNLGDKFTSLQIVGDVFEKFIGPWIEVTEDEYYRISPLLDNCGEEVWSPSKISKVRSLIIESILETGSINIFDANKLLLHSILSRDIKHFVSIASNLLRQIPEKSWNTTASHLSWLLAFKGEQDFFKNDDGALLFLRKLQFKIAVEVDESKANEVLGNWESESRSYKSNKQKANRLFLLISLLSYTKLNWDTFEVITLYNELRKITSELSEVEEGHIPEIIKSIKSPITRGEEPTDIFRNLKALIASSVNNLKRLNAFISQLSKTNTEEVNVFFEDFKVPNFISKNFSDSIWFNESTKNNPDWKRIVDGYINAINFFSSNEVNNLEILFTRALSTIYDEYQKDPTKALEIIEESLLKYPHDIILLEKKAVLLFNQEKYLKAINIWENIYSYFVESCTQFDREPLFTTRNLAISNAHLGQWTKAKDYFIEAIAFADQYEIEKYSAGLRADLAYVFFKLDDLENSLIYSRDSLLRCESLPDYEDDFHSFVFFKLLGHLITYIKQVNLDRNLDFELGEPIPGMCSNFNRSEDLRDLDVAPVHFLWYMLYAIEIDLGKNYMIQEKFYSFQDWKKYPSLFSLVTDIEIKQIIEDIDLNRLPIVIENSSKAFVASKKAHKNEIKVWQKYDFEKFIEGEEIDYAYPGLYLLFAILIKLANSDQDISKCLNRIKKRAKKPIQEIFTKVLNILELESKEAFNYYQGDKPENLKIFACLNLLLGTNTKPEFLYMASVYIFQFVMQGYLTDYYESDLAELYSKRWITVTQNRAIINMPYITVPNIISACSSNKIGREKIAHIILESEVAVSVKLPNNVKEQLVSVTNLD